MQLQTPLRVCALIALLLAGAAPAYTQNLLANARDLYTTAAYDDALKILDALPAGSPQDRETIGLYRALCLFALGRPDEAARVIDTLILENPLYRPDGDEIPPRVRTAFSDARRRLLPGIIQQKYNEGKAAYDRKEFAAAEATFTFVLEQLSDPDILPASKQPPLADLQTLATGFHALSAKAAAPPPPPPPAPAPPPPPARTVYTGNEPNVIPPSVLRQEIPTYVGRVLTRRIGVIELVVGESGKVESAVMTASIDPQYDKRVVAAAHNWTYMPATVNGKPVKFLRRVQVVLTPSAAPAP